jgi:multiple sugar transport system substrate-binding protein
MTPPIPWQWMRRSFLGFIILLSLAACSELPISGGTITPEASATATNPPAPTIEPTSTPARPATIRIWVPPEFDPQNNTAASQILQSRLDEFSERRSGMRVEVRVKSIDGAGGILDSLTTANAAAPLALPDLVLLPRSILETAALKGVLFSIDELVSPLDDGDWYPYAQQLAHLQNSTFGLPFAGDALILVYRPAVIEDAPRELAAALELGEPIIFPAANEQAYFTLNEYLAAGGNVQDEEGRPILEEQVLTEVLTIYQTAEASGVMPFWITQFTNDEQAWQAYTEGQSDMVVTWTSRFLSELPVDSAAAPIPTPEGTAIALANGWVWALSNPQVERHSASIELAEFLTASDFLAEWTAAAGYLPPRSSALEGWTNTTLQGLAEQIARSTQIFPPTDVMITVSPALQKAVVEVLKEQIDPETAAQEAVELVAGP